MDGLSEASSIRIATDSYDGSIGIAVGSLLSELTCIRKKSCLITGSCDGLKWFISNLRSVFTSKYDLLIFLAGGVPGISGFVLSVSELIFDMGFRGIPDVFKLASLVAVSDLICGHEVIFGRFLNIIQSCETTDVHRLCRTLVLLK